MPASLGSPRKVKFAADLPVPQKLTEADLERCAREGQELARRFGERTRSMEWLTGEDLAIVIR